ncbi:MAG: hypothetical protein IJ882_02475, partial [Paludibacteraceae bacterium]|nr:hypothetical protein [Paludibacteraceae bacterium]
IFLFIPCRFAFAVCIRDTHAQKALQRYKKKIIYAKKTPRKCDLPTIIVLFEPLERYMRFG